MTFFEVRQLYLMGGTKIEDAVYEVCRYASENNCLAKAEFNDVAFEAWPYNNPHKILLEVKQKLGLE